MLKVIKVTQAKIERGIPLCWSSRSPVARHVKHFGRLAVTVLGILLICLIAQMNREIPVLPQTTSVVFAQSKSPESDARKAFTQLKTLAGTWTGPATLPPMAGMSSDLEVRVSLRVTSGGDALMHEMVPKGRGDDPTNGADDPVTMFYLEGDGLLLTHYCDQLKNRPRMAAKLSADGKTVEFEFLDVGGSTKRGYMSHAVFTFIDANHHTEDWTTTMPGGKSATAHMDLRRTK